MNIDGSAPWKADTVISRSYTCRSHSPLPPLPPHASGNGNYNGKLGPSGTKSRICTARYRPQETSLYYDRSGGRFQKAREVGQTSSCKGHSIPLIHKCNFFKRFTPKDPFGNPTHQTWCNYREISPMICRAIVTPTTQS